MKNTNKHIDLENIKSELVKIGATFEIDRFGNILATLPGASTIASVPFKDKKNRRSNIEVREAYFFQNGVAVLYPARNNYRVEGISGFTITLSRLANK